MSDGGRYSGPKRDYRRSPPRNDRYSDRRNWSPSRNRRRDDDYPRRDPWGRDDRRRSSSTHMKFDGPMLSESQFNDQYGNERSYKYDEYKSEYKKYNARVYFNNNRTEPRFISIYHPNSIIERRKKDASEAQTLSAQFIVKLEDDSFVLPNYDAESHEELFSKIEDKEEKEEKKSVTEESVHENQINDDNKDENQEKGTNEKIQEEKANEGNLKQKKRYQGPPLVPEIAHERIGKDLELIKKLVRHFDDMRGITSNVLLGTQSTQQETKESKEAQDIKEGTKEQVTIPESFTELHDKFISYTEKQQLDLFIYYLAKVHFHCYYTCCTFPSQEREKVQDIYRCSDRIHDDIDSVDSILWAEELDKKIKDLLSLDLLVASGERRCDELMESFFKDKIIKDSAERFRCEICNKMFKGPIYVKKHISVKHPEKIEEIKEKAKEEQFYKNYLTHCDKLAIQQEKEEKEREKNRPKIDKDKDLREKKSPTRWASPPRTEKRARSPVDRSVDLRKRSPSRDDRERFSPGNDDRRNTSWRGRGSDWGRGRGRGGRYRDEPFDMPPELREKMDPRSKFVFKDLDKPPEDSIEIDYEKALAAFAVGDDDS